MVTIDEFQEIIYQQGDRLYRDMPWRQDTRPYYVLVSELMLQQTQVDRVIPKFVDFIEKFPDEKALADASLADVLRKWQGLGYNRRAKFLHDSANAIVKNGEFPKTTQDLILLPGVGNNTAGAIVAYAYDEPSIFIETNVRAVYIHHFFQHDDVVDDKAIIKKLEQTIDQDNPRRFYQAIMDYGTWLKKQGLKPSRSKSYKKQSPLQGSVREVRGQILKILSRDELTLSELHLKFLDNERFPVAIDGLQNDGLITIQGDNVYLTK